jgi:Gas vesicle synthesis protein GvpL/GvpF
MKSIGIGLHLQPQDVEPIAKAVAVSGLTISAIDVDDDQPLSDRDLLLRVAGLRANLLERATFVAVRYGFTFRSADDASAKLGTNAAKWKQILEENRTRVEMTLKVAVSGGQPKPDRHAFTSGADYLRALHAARNAAVVSNAFKAEVERTLGVLCVERRWMSRDSSSVEFAGLMERERLHSIEAAGESLKRACPEVPFLLSAPWPLEVFADVDHQ